MGKDRVVVVVVVATVEYSEHDLNRGNIVDFVHFPDLVGEGTMYLYAM